VLPTLFSVDAPLVSGVTGVDIDGDALTDRLYVADAAWRVWRLVRTPERNAPPGAFTATLLADLRSLAEAGAALQFAPDVALTGNPRSLAVSVGSSNAPAQLALRHWLFVLRDPLDVPALAPLHAEDLQRVGAAPDTALARDSRGLAAALPGPLAAPVLSVAGHRLVVTRASGPSATCPLQVEEEAETLQVSVLTPALEWRTRTVSAAPGSQLSIAVRSVAADAAEDAGRAGAPLLECRLGDLPLPECPQVRSVGRDYWVREDAQ